MRVNNIKELNLPQKSDEAFRKADFGNLFSYEYKNTKVLPIENLKSVEDKSTSEDILYNITQSIDKSQYVLNITKNSTTPIVLIHLLNENETLFTNSLHVKVSKGIKAELVEIFVNKSNNTNLFANRIISVKDNATLEYVKIQDFDDKSALLLSQEVHQGNNSNFLQSNFELGTGISVNAYTNILKSKEANYVLNALVKLKENAICSNIIKTIHDEKHTYSDIKYKNTLHDSSKALFKATSVVHNNAAFSKAFQNTNTILLSNDATIYAQPHLEILIDELDASHGATTGTLDKEQLLYLQSRGICKQKSYEMLLEAFEQQVFDNVQSQNLKEFASNYKRNDYV